MQAGFLTHPVPGEMNIARIGDINQWSLAAGIRYRFGAR